MGPFFRCRTCGSPSEQAAECAACGARTFVLSREARAAATSVLDREERCGQLVSIREAPSFGRRRRGWARG